MDPARRTASGDHRRVASTTLDRSDPFFIVGNDRSGTTMLRLILDRSREAAVPPESMFLADFAPVRRRGNLDDPVEVARLIARVWEHPKVRLWKLPVGPPAVPAGLGHGEAYRFAVESPFRAYATMQRKERWGDKTPSYLRCIDELVAVWPRARFVVLVRDGRDVTASVLRMPFGPNNVWAAARWWAQGIRAGRDAERKHRGLVLSVRYEDLVKDPPTSVRRVCEHVGLSYGDDMLAIEHSDPAKIVDDQAAWFPNMHVGINAAAVGKWRRELSERDVSLFASMAARELESLGYEPGPAQPPPVPPAVYAGHDAAMRVVNFVRLRLVRERGSELRWVLRRKVPRAL
jgi:hypothetical protein